MLSARRCRPPAGVVALAAAMTFGCADAPPSWDTVRTGIVASFPDVPHLTTRDLAALLDDPAREVTLLDVRTAREFAVSHLQGAVRVSSADEASAIIAAAPAHTTIVAYCSVGVRSAHLINALGDRTTRPVYNLEGSIFQWANENRPVYRGSIEVPGVHPFSESWGTLLDPVRHGDDPGR